MEISENNLLFKWAHLDLILLKDEKRPVPTTTTICDIVGRAVFVTPLFIVTMTTLGLVLWIPLI